MSPLIGLRAARRIALAAFAFIGFAAAGPALGQGATLAPPPENFATSPGGVDMRSGTYTYSQTDVAIGGENGLSMTRTMRQQVAGHNNPFGNFSHNWDILLTEKRIDIMHGEFSHLPGRPDYQIEVSYGGRSQTFRAQFDIFEQVSRAGYGVLTYSGDRNSGAVVYTYQAADGTVAVFRPLGSNDCSSQLRCAYVSQVTQPDGMVLSFDYDTSGGANATRLRTVTSSRGYALMLEYAGGVVSKSCVLNLSIQAVPSSHVCPTNAQSTSSYTYAGARLASATDAAGATWTFSYSGTGAISFINPGETTPVLTNTILPRANDDGLVEDIVQSQSFADGSGYSYSFTESPFVENHVSSLAGGSFTDALNNRTTLTYGFPAVPKPPSGGHGDVAGGPGQSDPTQYQMTPGPIEVTDPLGRTTTYDYCDPFAMANYPPSQLNRCLVSPMARTTTDPEGIRTDMLWDNAARTLLATHQVAKPGSLQPNGQPWPNIDRSATYAPCSPANVRFCTRPTTLTDARGNVATFTYAPEHGGVLTETGPPPSQGAPAPQTRHTYAQRRAWIVNPIGSGYVQTAPVWVRVSSSTCRTSAPTGNPCALAGDEVRIDYDYGPDQPPNNLLLRGQTVTSTDGGVTTIFRTCYTYDALGRRISETLPNANALSCPATQTPAAAYTTATRYDGMGRATGTISADPDGAGPLPFMAVRNTYDGAGRLIRAETGTLSTWQSETVSPASWTGFTILRTLETAYDPVGHKVREVLRGSDGVIQSLTRYSYDRAGRLDCTTIRMNPANFAGEASASLGSLPDACVPLTAGANGPDRITRNFYDAAGQRVQVREGVGTNVEAAEATWDHNLNGQVTTMIDANGNRAALRYDGHGRQDRWTFPSTTRPPSFNDANQGTALASAGSVNAADYEAYTYDPNGNRLNLRKRDGRNIAFAYDALNRVTAKTFPNGGATAVYYGYDLRNLQTFARFGSTSGEGISNGFDGFGRLASTSTNMGGITRSLSYAYDRDGDRTRITHPDGQWFGTNYDGLDRPYYLNANGTTSIAYTNFFNYGAPSAIDRPGVSTGYAYDSLQRTYVILHYLGAPTGNVAWALGRNPAGQINSVFRDNDVFAWTGDYNVNRPYTTNGLNQYSAAGDAGFTYDANGNLVTATVPSVPNSNEAYAYDVENRLVSVTGGHNATLSYDPLGRLWRVTSGGTTRTFLYDGDAMVAEYSGTTLLRRHVHNVGADVPMVTYEVANGTGLGTPYQLLANHQGSIVAQVSTGGAATVNRYDEYGIPAASNTGTFGYTGQIWLPEIGLYHYKARVYSPTLGRFLQVDPIGYAGGNNIYAYVGNDPLNLSDPSGLYRCGTLDQERCRGFNGEDEGGGGGTGSGSSGTQQPRACGGGGCGGSGSTAGTSAGLAACTRNAADCLAPRPGSQTYVTNPRGNNFVIYGRRTTSSFVYQRVEIPRGSTQIAITVYAPPATTISRSPLLDALGFPGSVTILTSATNQIPMRVLDHFDASSVAGRSQTSYHNVSRDAHYVWIIATDTTTPESTVTVSARQ